MEGINFSTNIFFDFVEYLLKRLYLFLKHESCVGRGRVYHRSFRKQVGTTYRIEVAKCIRYYRDRHLHGSSARYAVIQFCQTKLSTEESRPYCLGKPMLHCKIEIVDPETFAQLPPFSKGFIAIKGT